MTARVERLGPEWSDPQASTAATADVDQVLAALTQLVRDTDPADVAVTLLNYGGFALAGLGLAALPADEMAGYWAAVIAEGPPLMEKSVKAASWLSQRETKRHNQTHGNNQPRKDPDPS